MYLPLTWNMLHKLSTELARNVKKDGYAFDVIVAIARGGMPIATIMADALNLRNVATFTVSTYEQMHKKKEAQLVLGCGDQITGKRVLLVDDISDSGESLAFGIDYLNKMGVTSLKTATVFAKPGTSSLPDFYVQQTTEWVIFPYEVEETREICHNIMTEDREKGMQLDEAIQDLELQ
ncbi:MAG: phosphoribosyltransferase [Patescibacteria group bacterium]